MRLSVRLTLVFSVMGLLIVCAVAATSWLVSARQIRTSVDASLNDRAGVLVSLTQGEVGAALRRGPDEDLDAQPLGGEDAAGVLILDNGSVLGSAPLTVTPEMTQRVLDDDEWFETVEVDDRTYRVLAQPVPEIVVGGEIDATVSGALLFEDVTAEEDAIASLALWLTGLGAAAIAAVALGSWFVGRWLARPLVSLTTAAEHLTDQDGPVQRIEVDRRDEIGRLADQFNRLFASLEVGREQQQRLVADASHELRTPLTALRMRAEFVASFPTLTVDQRSVATGAVEDVEQLSALVADLVDLASHTQTQDEQPERRQLSSIVETVVERTSLATGRPIELVADDSEAIVYPTMIRRAVQNLIDNAVKYSPADQPVTVRIDQMRIEVIDQGAGIAPEDLPFVFDRFFRSPKARNRPGNGIGLAIVSQVAAAHGGRPFAENAAPAGACVGFTLS